MAPEPQMTPALPKRRTAFALLFAAAMGLLYWWAMSDPEPAQKAAAAPTAPVEAPPPKAATPGPKPAAPSPSRRSPAPPPRAPAPPPPDGSEGEEDGEDAPEEQRFVIVEGRVVEDNGSLSVGTRVIVQVDGRKRYYTTNEDGVFGARQLAGEVVLWAQRKDGALTTISDKITIDGSGGGEWEVELVLPSARKAGLGVRIRKVDDGIAIGSVIPGSPAAELGLEIGDVVTYIGNEATEDMEVQDFVGRMTGEEGSSQDFTVRRSDGTEEDLTLVRQAIQNRPRSQRATRRSAVDGSGGDEQNAEDED